MRNPELDKILPIDSYISELFQDNKKNYRFVCGIKIYQIKEITQQDKDKNLIINRYREQKLLI